MNLAQHSDLLDHLAARHAIGLLRGRARRRLEAQARQSAVIRARMLLWQERIQAIMEIPPSNTGLPSPNVWKRIENSLQALPKRLREASEPLLVQAQAAVAKLQRALNWWRAGAVMAGLAALMAGIVSLQSAQQLEGRAQQMAQLQQQFNDQKATLVAQQQLQQVQFVAVLADDQSQASILVTFDPDKRRLVLQRVGNYQEAQDKSLQLWALPPGQAPQSLGVMGNDKVLRLTAGAEQVRDVPTLAISLEPKGGVPSSRGPTGPVLFKGALLKTVL
jgi:anti-sigma-K factor RskA